MALTAVKRWCRETQEATNKNTGYDVISQATLLHLPTQDSKIKHYQTERNLVAKRQSIKKIFSSCVCKACTIKISIRTIILKFNVKLHRKKLTNWLSAMSVINTMSSAYKDRLWCVQYGKVFGNGKGNKIVSGHNSPSTQFSRFSVVSSEPRPMTD